MAHLPLERAKWVMPSLPPKDHQDYRMASPITSSFDQKEDQTRKTTACSSIQRVKNRVHSQGLTVTKPPPPTEEDPRKA